MSPHLYFPLHCYHTCTCTILNILSRLGAGGHLIGALTWAEPYGLVPTNPASQAWTSVLAWYTGHPVGGLRHPGTCLSRRAFPTILALQPSLDQRPCLPHWPPGLWLAALAGATTAGGWGTLHRLVGYSCPCPSCCQTSQ